MQTEQKTWPQGHDISSPQPPPAASGSSKQMEHSPSQNSGVSSSLLGRLLLLLHCRGIVNGLSGLLPIFGLVYPPPPPPPNPPPMRIETLRGCDSFTLHAPSLPFWQVGGALHRCEK